MFVRVISSKECHKCQDYKNELDSLGFKFVIFDADAEENQQQLDAWYIDDMPVVQIVQPETNIVLYQFPPGKQKVSIIQFKINQLIRKINNGIK